MTGTACIIETRALPNLIDIISSHMKHLEGWDLIVLGSENNKEIIKENFPDARFINVGFDIDIFTYNKLLTSVAFWRIFRCNKVLIFQHDSFIFKPLKNKFFKYDYVGAPWKFQTHGGNGGLSLRGVRAMISVCEKYTYNEEQHGNEDVYFSNHLALSGGILAPREICKEFSVESIFALNTFGYHAIEKHLTKEQVDKIKTQYEKM